MVTDFREELNIQQVSKNEFAYCWAKIDTAIEELVDCDYEQECSFEEMMNAVCIHGFDADKVYNHFISNPCDSITLTDEY